MSRTLVAGAALAALAIASPSGAAPPESARLDARVVFNIAAQPLDAALLQYSRQTGLQVVSQSATVANRNAPAIYGPASGREAITQLLEGTNLAFAVVGPNTIAIAEAKPARASTPPPQASAQRRPVVIAARAAARPQAALAASASEALPELVVTGSLIPGVAPVGTNVSAMSAADIQRSGAHSTNQILSQIPQLTNAFNTLAVTPSSAGRSTFRPDLRGLGNVGHATTLVLIDGHNAVGSGILQTTADAGMLPPGAVERLEVVADGGSSIYGSDAVGGILNFITRTRFDGFEVSGSRGIADDYDAFAVSVTGGLESARGSAMLSFYTRQNSELLSIHRARPRQNLTPFGGSDFRGRSCAPGNIIVGAATYALPSRAPGLNLCDTSELGNLAPAEAQNALFSALTYRLADHVEFELKAFGSERRTRNYVAQRTSGNAVITDVNPFFSAVGTEASQAVAFSYAPVAGVRSQNRSSLSAWQITPQVVWAMGGGWRTRFMFDMGWSETTAFVPQVNAQAELAALRGPNLTTTTALNPYDLTRTNQQVISDILNWADQSGARQAIRTWRAISDGSLFRIPGGEVRTAIGVQRQYSEFKGYQHVSPVGLLYGGNDVSGERTVDAIFGELIVPLVGAANALPGVKAFELDLAARHDDYSDVGHTTNPKIGANWTVVDGLSVRGNYGTSFTAPSLADTTAAVNKSVQVLSNPTLRPGDPPSERLRPYVTLNGGTPRLEPMPATTWSVGLDLRPHQAPGLEFSLTYWSIDMDKRVGLAPPASTDLYTVAGYANFYTLHPSLPQVLEAAAETGGYLSGAANLQSLYGVGNDPYVLVDLRRKNLGRLKVSGLDYRVANRHLTNWGAVYGRVSGAYKLRQKERAAVGAAYMDRLANNTVRSTAQAMVGADAGRFTARGTVNYTGGFPVLGLPSQTRVKAFASTNLFFRYETANDLQLTLNIDNLFNINPPLANVSGGIPAVGGVMLAGTLGRYWNFGLSKPF